MNIFETLKKYNNMNGGSLENTSLKRNVLVPYEEYEISKDKRLLIPFEYNGLKGFMNKDGGIVVKPKYHIICNECYSEQNLIKVGVIKSVYYLKNNGDVHPYLKTFYGLIDGKGEELFETNYTSIKLSTDKKILTLNSNFVVTIDGKEIVPFGKYAWIDGFDNGLARFNTIINDKKKWGIINDLGEEVVPPIYDEVYNFFGKNRTTTTCIENGCRKEFSLTDLSFIANKKTYLKK